MVEVELALQTLGAMKGLVTGAFNAKVDHEVRSAQYEIQSKMLDLQGHLLKAVQERLALVNDLDAANRKVRELEQVRSRLDAYELVQLEAGAYLYKAKDHAVEHFVCPTCYDAGAVTVLQASKSGSQQTHYRCGTCKFSRYVGPSDRLDRSTARGRFL